MAELKFMAIKLVIIISLITSSAAQLGLNEEREQLQRGVDCNINCHTRVYDPVCGTNGVTYDNICDLEKDICKQNKIRLKHHGECSLKEKCIDSRAYRMSQVKNGVTIHVPSCRPDGSYDPIQCHNFTRFCWCARPDGEMVPETIIKGKTPQCTENRSEEPSPPEASKKGKFIILTLMGKGKRQVNLTGIGTEANNLEEAKKILLSLKTVRPSSEKCRGRKRSQFFKNMNKLLIQGYKNNVNHVGHSEKRIQKEAVKWKFGMLDSDSDGSLKRSEYSQLPSIVTRHVKPKKCAKHFPKLCDSNRDKKITQEEWINCFSSRRRGGKRKGRKCKKKNCESTSRTKEPVHKHDCERERRQLLQENSVNNSIPIPVCQPNGKYAPVQCHKDICMCVDVITGNSLEGSAVKNDTLDCSKPLPHGREWPGCVGDTKKKFMKALKDYLLKGVDPQNRNNPPVNAQPHWEEEFAANYHFKTLDKNNNDFIEKKEKKDIKKLLKSPKLRRCGRKLAVYCDVDKDRKISLEEWVACVFIFPHPGGNDVVVIRRLGNNPVETYLRPEEDEVQYPRRPRDVRNLPIPLLIYSNRKKTNYT